MHLKQCRHDGRGSDYFAAVSILPDGFGKISYALPVEHIKRPVHLAYCVDEGRPKFFVDGQVTEFLYGTVGEHDAIDVRTEGRARAILGFSGHFDNWDLPDQTVFSLRVSGSSRYSEPFEPPKRLSSDSETLVLYDAAARNGNIWTGLSGNGHDVLLRRVEWVTIDNANDGGP